jgi:hypothetical protein
MTFTSAELLLDLECERDPIHHRHDNIGNKQLERLARQRPGRRRTIAGRSARTPDA